MYDFATKPKEVWEEIQRGVQMLDPFLAFYQVARDEFVGRVWPGVPDTRPVNLVYEMVSTVESYLSMPRLRAAVKAKTPAAQQYAEIVRLSQDQQFEELKIHNILEEAGSECLFAPFAMIDVGRQEGGRVAEIDGTPGNVTQCYARVIPLADAVVDSEAISWEVKRFAGHRVTMKRNKIRTETPYGVDDPAAAYEKYGVEVMTREEATDWLLKLSDRKNVKSETGTRKRSMREKDTRGVRDKETKELDEIDLWRICVYQGDETFIVYVNDGPTQPEKFIHVERWQDTNIRNDGNGGFVEVGGGTKQGPLKFVSFQGVRASLLGLPGLATIYDLHEASKKISTKLVNQLLALKNLLLYSRDAAGDAARVAKAKDQDSLAVTDASKFQVAQIGGTRAELEPGLRTLGEWFGNTGGGLRQMGGSEQSADTATAASYLQNGAQMRLTRFRNRIYDCACDVAMELAFLGLFADPKAYRTVQMALMPGVSVPLVFNRANIMADAMMFTFGLMQFPAPVFDPMMMAQRTTQFLGLVMQSLPGIQMGVINPAGLANLGRTCYGIDDIDSLVNLDQFSPQIPLMLASANANLAMPAQLQMLAGGQQAQQEQQGPPNASKPQNTAPPAQRGLQSMGGPQQVPPKGKP